jgi:hypothetical protein
MVFSLMAVSLRQAPGLLIADPPIVLDLATALLPDEIGDPPRYCIDDCQNRDGAPHRKPYLAAAGYVIAVATEYPIGEGPVLSQHKLAGNIGERLQNEADPNRPHVFDDRQHRRSTGSVLLLIEQAFYSIPPGLAGCRIDKVASLAGTALHRMIGVSRFPQPWIVGLAFHYVSCPRTAKHKEPHKVRLTLRRYSSFHCAARCLQG